jgi:hypothetical protein
MDEKQEAAPAPQRGVTLTQILGRVGAGADVEVDSADRPAENNTRWVFDIEIDAHREPAPIELVLLSYRTGRPIDPDLLSFSIAPMSAAAWDAKPWIFVEGGKLTLHALQTAKPCLICISVDVMHSATR